MYKRQLLDRAAGHYVGRHDFSSFCTLDKRERGDLTRTVTKAQVRRQGDLVTFTVAADGFLYNMVRIMVGTLLRVQQGKFSPEDIPAILEARDRKADVYKRQDIDVSLEYYLDILKRQAVVNAGITFHLKNEVAPGKFETTDFCYENGILDHARELMGEDALTPVQFWQSEKKVRDRADMALYLSLIHI